MLKNTTRVVVTSPMCNFIGLVAALNSAISLRKRRLYVDPYQAHQLVSSMYNWRDIARRTEVVYDKVNFCCNPTDPERMSIFMKFGYMTGPLFCLVLGLGRILMWLCNLFVPIEVARFTYIP